MCYSNDWEGCRVREFRLLMTGPHPVNSTLRGILSVTKPEKINNKIRSNQNTDLCLPWLPKPFSFLLAMEPNIYLGKVVYNLHFRAISCNFWATNQITLQIELVLVRIFTENHTGAHTTIFISDSPCNYVPAGFVTVHGTQRSVPVHICSTFVCYIMN